MTVASAFATTVGLLANFMAERRHAESADIDEFLSWVSEHGFEDLRKRIESNGQTAVSIKALLKERSEVILERLDRLDSVLASVAGETEGMRELAVAFAPDTKLSAQAIGLLQQLEERQASGFFELRIMGTGRILTPYEGGADLNFDDPRFIEDDLNTLVELGFLRHGKNPKGENKYGFTRAASDYVKLLEQTLSCHY